MIEQEKLVNIVGAANVSCDQAALNQYSRDVSFVNPVRPACVVKPSSAGEIKQIVALANETSTPLVPVSSGPPHFRGDTVPCIGGSVMVDLSGMKKIINVDRPRRVAMVEPGVTFGELIAATKKEDIRLNMPLLPRSTKSVIASILEREPVIMPKYQWDASDPLACVEIYFGAGDEFRTGQAAGPGSVEEQWKVGGVQKAPYGPGIGSWHRMIQGSQGTMGIVTWASMRCELLPKVEEPFVVGSANLKALIEMASWLIRLKAVNECFILNDTNMAAIFARNWPGEYQSLKDKLPAWNLFYTVAGYEVFPEERVSAYIKDITDLTKRLALETGKSSGGISANQILKAVQNPCEEPYWKIRYKGASEDIFFLTLNNKIEDSVKTMKDAASKAGYAVTDMGVYIQPVVQGTSVHCEFNLFYDPANKTDVNKVKGLTMDATRALLARNAFFSRPYGEVTDMIVNRDAATRSVQTKLKNIFDPKGIMNPGKLGF
ncbi:MAG: FAD-binding oxidoreductase [Dehalococcoidales bacterium]|nr:FAD-binding oxidoreductase [Dehalococcoidales bacterium]